MPARPTLVWMGGKRPDAASVWVRADEARSVGELRRAVARRMGLGSETWVALSVAGGEARDDAVALAALAEDAREVLEVVAVVRSSEAPHSQAVFMGTASLAAPFRFGSPPPQSRSVGKAAPSPPVSEHATTPRTRGFYDEQEEDDDDDTSSERSSVSVDIMRVGVAGTVAKLGPVTASTVRQLQTACEALGVRWNDVVYRRAGFFADAAPDASLVSLGMHTGSVLLVDELGESAASTSLASAMEAVRWNAAETQMRSRLEANAAALDAALAAVTTLDGPAITAQIRAHLMEALQARTEAERFAAHAVAAPRHPRPGHMLTFGQVLRGLDVGDAELEELGAPPMAPGAPADGAPALVVPAGNLRVRIPLGVRVAGAVPAAAGNANVNANGNAHAGGGGARANIHRFLVVLDVRLMIQLALVVLLIGWDSPQFPLLVGLAVTYYIFASGLVPARWLTRFTVTELGRVPPAHVEGWFVDAYALVSSFFLSFFPAWRVQPQAQNRAAGNDDGRGGGAPAPAPVNAR